MTKTCVVSAIATWSDLDSEFVALLGYSNHINVLIEARATAVQLFATCMAANVHQHCFTFAYTYANSFNSNISAFNAHLHMSNMFGCQILAIFVLKLYDMNAFAYILYLQELTAA